MTFSLVEKAFCLFLLSGVFTTSLGDKEGRCTVRRTKTDKIRPLVSTPGLCADSNFCMNFYNAVPLAGCTCACAPTNSTFKENLGTCVANTAIRKGCASYVYFTGETGSDFLRLLKNTSSASLKVGLPNYRDCSVVGQSSQYFTKVGWISLNGYQAGFPFKIQQIRQGRKFVQLLKWNDEPKSSLLGHLIKLDVNCKITDRKGKIRLQSGCLMFKVGGGIQVPCTIPTTTKPSVIPSQLPTGQKSPAPITTSASHFNDSGGTTKVTDSTSEPGASSTSPDPTDQTNPPALRDTSTQLPVNVIIAVAIAVTAVAVACIVGFLLLFCRRKRQRGERAGNPTYQTADDSTLPLHQIPDEPLYATVSSPKRPSVYQPLTLQRTSKDYELLVKQPLEDPSGYLEPVENTTKHLDPKEYDYACPESVLEGGTLPESARYASADDVGFIMNGQSSRDPTSPFYNVLVGGSPKSPAGFTFRPSEGSGPEDTSSSSPQRNPHSSSEELRPHSSGSGTERSPDNPPTSPVTYLELLPDYVPDANARM